MDAGPSNYYSKNWIKYRGKSVYFAIYRFFSHGWEEVLWKILSRILLKTRIILQ